VAKLSRQEKSLGQAEITALVGWRSEEKNDLAGEYCLLGGFVSLNF
jgi:hypothetical protein